MPNSKTVRHWFRRFVPSHINDPVGLVRRLLASGSKTAKFTLITTGLGILLSPLDYLISKIERQSSSPTEPCGPHIFICGPARSGTTLLYQILAENLEVAYTQNLSSLFPRSARTSVWLCQKLLPPASRRKVGEYANYYGKTYGFSAPSEANFLWNQWVDTDKSGFRTVVSDASMQKAAEYYRTLSCMNKLPTLAKNNNANVFASALHQQLDNSYFICTRRDTKFLAQSLITARLTINGDIEHSYGVVDTNDDRDLNNPYDEVLEQIAYLNLQAQRQQDIIGKSNFWIVDYEETCNNPTELVNRIRQEILKSPPLATPIQVIENNNKIVNELAFGEIARRVGSN